MIGGNKLIDEIKIELINHYRDHIVTVYIDVFDNSLSKKWLTALNDCIQQQKHLEKNYCFLGFTNHQRDGILICDEINRSIKAVNEAKLGYHIDDYFRFDECVESGPVGDGLPGRKIRHDRFNNLHRYFEDLQGVSGAISSYYKRADDTVKWHIRQLNLLCHEFETWAMSWRKSLQAPEWQRPSQLMCWLNAPRFELDEEDFELFGIDTIARPLGGVFVGVNKAVGKHHWEVFHDEGRDSRIGELTTTTLRSQTEAAADFDIEWANNPGDYEFMKKELKDFRSWLIENGFDPEDKKLTIGHPQCGQVDLVRSFGTNNYQAIWSILDQHLDVFSVSTSIQRAEYPYRWSDVDYIQQQVIELGK